MIKFIKIKKFHLISYLKPLSSESESTIATFIPEKVAILCCSKKGTLSLVF